MALFKSKDKRWWPRNIFEIFYEKIYENLIKSDFEFCDSTEDMQKAQWFGGTVKIKTKVPNKKGEPVLVVINLCYSSRLEWHSYSMEISGVEIRKEKGVYRYENITFSQRMQYKKLEKICSKAINEDLNKNNQYYKIEDKNKYKRLIGEELIENPYQLKDERSKYDEKIPIIALGQREERCGNCKYCKALNVLADLGIQDKELDLYECVMHPPQQDPKVTMVSSFPQIKHDDWCGEWKPKE